MLDENELLFDELYEKTKDFGRVQFINLLMEKERETKELKKQLEVGKEQYNDLVEEKEELQEQLSNSHQIKNQQKEFIEYLEDYIDALKQQKETVEGLDIGEEHILMILEEVLEKYKEIIGVKDE